MYRVHWRLSSFLSRGSSQFIYYVYAERYRRVSADTHVRANLPSCSLVLQDVHGKWARIRGSGVTKVRAVQSLTQQGALEELKIASERTMPAKVWDGRRESRP